MFNLYGELKNFVHSGLSFVFRYSCNRYDEKDAMAARDAQAVSSSTRF